MVNKEDLVRRRRIAGIMSLSVGIPNLVLALLVSLGGLAATIGLGILVFAFYSGDSGDNPFGALCLVMLVILFIALMLMALVLTIISVIFAIAMGGQTIGGYFAFKGVNFKRTIALIFMGSFAALLMGMVLLIYALSHGLRDIIHLISFGLGIFEMISFVTSLISGILVIGTRSTFVKIKGKGPLKRLKDRKMKRKKKSKATSEI